VNIIILECWQLIHLVTHAVLTLVVRNIVSLSLTVKIQLLYVICEYSEETITV